jgi:peptidoglycan/LPS O-acetylase OafA/YrhL
MSDREPTLPSAPDTRIHFVGFTGLRFFLAYAVLIFHLEIFKADVELPSLIQRPYMRDLGQTAVTCFFVLSGFLITYLLFVEKTVKESINVRAFYMRRILRIWPGYFMVLLTGLFLWPHVYPFVLHNHMQTTALSANIDKLSLFVFMLPNVVYLFAPLSFFITHLWSVGVEEQFYAFWPWIVKKLNRYGLTLWGIIGLSIGIKLLVAFLLHFTQRGTISFFVLDRLYLFLGITRFDNMAIGALSAYYLFFHNDRVKRLYPFWLGVLVWILFGFMSITDVFIPYFKAELYSFVFALCLLAIALYPNYYQWLDVRPLRYLGKISYGIYIYHLVPTAFAVFGYKALFPYQDLVWYSNVSIYVLATLGTIVISSLSYRFIEKPFLNLKKNFERVRTVE